MREMEAIRSTWLTYILLQYIHSDRAYQTARSICIEAPLADRSKLKEISSKSSFIKTVSIFRTECHCSVHTDTQLQYNDKIHPLASPTC